MVSNWTRRLFNSICLSAIICASLCQLADAQQPQPDAALKKFEPWVGKWTYTGEAQASPFGPSGKFVGDQSRKMVLNGFFLEEQWEDKTGTYVAQGTFLTGYDAAAKNFVLTGFENDGSVSQGVAKIEGNKYEGKLTRKAPTGKPYLIKTTILLSDAGAPQEETVEYSADEGKTWTPYFVLTFKKVE